MKEAVFVLKAEMDDGSIVTIEQADSPEELLAKIAVDAPNTRLVRINVEGDTESLYWIHNPTPGNWDTDRCWRLFGSIMRCCTLVFNNDTSTGRKVEHVNASSTSELMRLAEELCPAGSELYLIAVQLSDQQIIWHIIADWDRRALKRAGIKLN